MIIAQLSASKFKTILLLTFVWLQYSSLTSVWSHVSDDPQLFGRFSLQYGVFAVFAILWLILWLVVLWRRDTVFAWLARIPPRLRLMLVVSLSLGMLLFVLQQRIDHKILANITLNVALLQGCMVFTLPASSRQSLQWWLGSSVLTLLLLIPMSITNLSGLDFSPDEAIWAEVAVAYLVEGNVYQRVWYAEPWFIKPGVGWFIALYAHLLDTFGMDIRVGRSINLFFDFLTYGMLFIIARHLYNWRVALATVLIAIFGGVYVGGFDYRPDNYNAVPFLIAFFAVLKAWHPQTRYRFFWSFVSGFAPTLAMQIHASAITMSVTVVLFHTIAWLWTRLRPADRTPYDHQRFIGMILGAGIGTGIFWLLNVLSVGGLTPFLTDLLSARGRSVIHLRYLNLNLFEQFLLLPPLALMLWRFGYRDKLILLFTLCFILSIPLLDTQGYVIPYRAIFYVHAGYWLWEVARWMSDDAPERHLRWLTFIAVMVLLANFTMPFVDSQSVRHVLRNGQLPDHRIHRIADEIASRLQPDELVISTHELIWGVGGRPLFYSEAAQVYRSRAWGITPYEVWEHIAPDVVVYIRGRMPMTDELAQYIDAHMVLCEQYPLHGYEVIFYRLDCDTNP